MLDIGCGAGLTTRQAARAAAPARVEGIDISERMVEQARQATAAEGIGNVGYQLGDAQTHPFTPGAFDVAISRFATMFFTDPGCRVREHRHRLALQRPIGVAGVAAQRSQRMGAGDQRRAR